MKLGLLPLTGSNFFSITNALPSDVDWELVSELSKLDQYTHLILPGVGHASKLVFEKEEWQRALKNYSGWVLGICLGMQAFFDFLDEAEVEGLGLFAGRVRKIPKEDFPIPHIGWQTINFQQESPLFKDIENSSFYFVHSFAAEKSQQSLATFQYNGEWTAAVQQDKWIGVQFHPEKSGEAGLKFLNNFLELDL